ncbi:MAG: hypothetical protein Q7O66_06395, partial [Dehalococcoidia bacterium]|nr:hypothetical protein [Dehalococcoidia bacterium]
WPSPRAGTPGSRPNKNGGKILAAEVKNWPTPCTMDTLPPKDQEALDQARTKGGCGNLREWVYHNGTFIYDQNHPDQSNGGGSQVESWATPQARDWKGPQGRAYKEMANDLPAMVQWGTPRSQMGGNKTDTGKFRLEEQTKAGANLSPRWTEILMGLPLGWTLPSCAQPWIIALTNSASSETALIPMLLLKPL